MVYSYFRATKFLETCKLLRMEDILPFFSDTATIDPLRVGSRGIAILPPPHTCPPRRIQCVNH